MSYDVIVHEALLKLRTDMQDYFSHTRGGLRHGGDLSAGMSIQYRAGYARAVEDVESRVMYAIRCAISDHQIHQPGADSNE